MRDPSFPYLVEQWDDAGNRVIEVLAKASLSSVGVAAYEAALKARPGAIIFLRSGARVIRSSERDADERTK